MEKIESISVAVEHRARSASESCESSPCSVPTGNLIPLLYEVRHALDRWLDIGAEHIIDLRSLPMGPGEEQRLLDILGRGEVETTLSALGSSDIFETAFNGVWLVTHRNDSGDLVGRYIEICEIPAILKSQPDDARAALQRLDELLSNAEVTE